MSLSLPATPATARSLTGVVPQVLASLEGRGDWFRPARSAIVVVVDGLGRANLSARSGHARHLAARLTKRSVARTAFPSTTATALTGLLTGTDAGSHGIVGYRVRIPGTDQAPNQLQGWETDGLDPLTWQRAQPLLERESDRGRACFVVSQARYADTGFTRAILRGGAFTPAETIADRLSLAAELAGGTDGAIVYTYVSELDSTGHARGWESPAWTERLEEIDDAIRRFTAGLRRDVGVVVTADHGMVDVAAHRHVLLGEGDPLLDGVRVIAGEPRMLHLHVDAADAASALQRWRDAESHRSWVLSRDEAIAHGLFGDVDPDVVPRIGDILVAARAGIAYYDDRLPDKKPQRMIGQHGSLTDEERIVPLLGFGAFTPE